MRTEQTGFAVTAAVWLLVTGGIIVGVVSPVWAGRHFHGGVRLAASESSYMVPTACQDQGTDCPPGTATQTNAEDFSLRTASTWGLMWVVVRVYPSVCQEVPTRMLGVCSKDVREAEMDRRGLSAAQRRRL